jgi:4-amino-4-deoxy-L-arabinose transferase-like glycosyltransferase
VREGLSRPLWLALVIAAFCVPLFIGLDRTDVESDEAIYSYAVDGILAHGDWLNPRSSPHEDAVFLEKPPLKFWIVAAPIRLGLLPHNEFGLRFWDALFGAVAFVYVFSIGKKLAGPLCGLVAVMVLFVNGPLVFEHGLRGNNMEAPLFLCYCGGIYHYLAWGTDEDRRARRRHVVAVGLYFFLGFMTKFVAALFLPVILAISSIANRETRKRVVTDMSAWMLAAGVVIVLASPWFVYQQFKSGNELWRIIFGVHVYQRFTVSLDPGHIHPWNYYYVEIWRELLHMGTAWLMVAGGILLCAVTWRERRLEQITVLAWAVVPLGLMSAVASKLPHYAYPFLPPVALMVGFGPGWIARVGRHHVDRIMEVIQDRLARRTPASTSVRRALLVLTVLSMVVAALTLVFGTLTWRVGGVQVFRNSHVSRPLVLALVLATIGGRGVAAARVVFPVALLLLVLPVNAYENMLTRASIEDHPVRTAAACLLRVRAAELRAGRPAPGILSIGEHKWFLHNYYYYLHHVGGWERLEAADTRTLEHALLVPGHQRPTLVDDASYRGFKAGREVALQSTAVLPLREVLLLMPGPYAVCGPTSRVRTGN